MTRARVCVCAEIEHFPISIEYAACLQQESHATHQQKLTEFQLGTNKCDSLCNPHKKAASQLLEET